MTHMDDQVAKHIREMLHRVMQNSDESQRQPPKPGTLSQVSQALRRGPDYPYDLVRLTRSLWADEIPRT